MLFETSRDVSMNAQELKFYESLINKFKESASESLLNKRASQAKEDPTEELIELHLEIQEIEKQFKEVIEISCYMLKKNKEMDEFMSSAASNVRASGDSSGGRGMGGMKAAREADIEKDNLLAQIRE